MSAAPKTLLHVFSTFKVGGPQMRFARLANHFGRDYRHRIIAMDGAVDAFDLLDKDLDAEIVPTPGRAGGTLAQVRAFRRILGQLRPDVLVTSNWGSIEWAMANLGGHTPHLHMEDGFGPEEAGGQLPRRVWTRRLVLRRSTVMLPSSTLYRIASEIWKLPRHRLVRVPNGIDCDRFSRAADPDFAASLGIARDRPVIGTVAALRAEKNLMRLIEAFHVLPAGGAQLAIVGSGPQRSALEARVDELNLRDRVVFTGACATPERLLPSFTLFAMSSDTEQMPLSLLEAMAAGLPVAATDVGDVKEMASSENASFIVPLQQDRLAEAIAGLLADPGRAAAIGAANAARARAEYDQSRMFATYRTLFDPASLAGRAVT
jgi:glycosyltransferase involved in cell wall biosynthesis